MPQRPLTLAALALLVACASPASAQQPEPGTPRPAPPRPAPAPQAGPPSQPAQPAFWRTLRASGEGR
jgi:hypothetical protein